MESKNASWCDQWWGCEACAPLRVLGTVRKESSAAPHVHSALYSVSHIRTKHNARTPQEAHSTYWVNFDRRFRVGRKKAILFF